MLVLIPCTGGDLISIYIKLENGRVRLLTRGELPNSPIRLI